MKHDTAKQIKHTHTHTHTYAHAHIARIAKLKHEEDHEAREGGELRGPHEGGRARERHVRHSYDNHIHNNSVDNNISSNNTNKHNTTNTHNSNTCKQSTFEGYGGPFKAPKRSR